MWAREHAAHNGHLQVLKRAHASQCASSALSYGHQFLHAWICANSDDGLIVYDDCSTEDGQSPGEFLLMSCLSFQLNATFAPGSCDWVASSQKSCCFIMRCLKCSRYCRTLLDHSLQPFL